MSSAEAPVAPADSEVVYDLDYETFYTKEYSLKVMPTRAYVYHKDFDAYLLAVAGTDGFQWVGHPKDFDWAMLEGKIVAHHNAQFDALVTIRLVELGIIPKVNFKEIVDTADLARYLQRPAALKDYARFVWGLTEIADKGEAARERMRGKATSELCKDPEILEYATTDARLSLRIWTESASEWPPEERALSSENRKSCFRGIAVDEAYVNVACDRMARKLFAAEKAIPWDWAGRKTPLSRVKIIANCNNTLIESRALTAAEIEAIKGFDLETHHDAALAALRKASPAKVAEPGEEPETPHGREEIAKDGEGNWALNYYMWYPASFAQDDEDCLRWEDEYGDTYPWLGALRDWRRINMLYGKIKHLRDNTFDGIFYPQIKYFGARTGRFSGDGKFNMQNLPRAEMFCDIGPDGKPIEGSGCDLRRCFIARPGRKLAMIDYAQIEARALVAVVGDERVLPKLRVGMSIYQAHAEATTGRTWGNLKKEDFGLYQSKKMEVLLLGYQGGGAKLASAAYKMTKDSPDPAGVVKWTAEQGKAIVDAYRADNPLIVNLWYKLDKKLRVAGARNEAHSELTLHSGRPLYYWRPRFRIPAAKPGEKPQKATLMAMQQMNDPSTYRKIYGGLLTENCLIRGSLVLTDSGWKPIEKIEPHDKIHDGVDFVSHGGVVSKSVQPCVTVDGVGMTADHEVLTHEGWAPASHQPEPYRPGLRDLSRASPIGERRQEDEMGVPMPLWELGREGRNGSDEGSSAGWDPELWLPYAAVAEAQSDHSRDVQASGVRGVARHVGSVSATDASCVEKLRRAGHNSVPTVAGPVRELLDRYGADVSSGLGAGQDQQQPRVQPHELQMGEPGAERAEHPVGSGSRVGFGRSESQRGGRVDAALPTESGNVAGEGGAPGSLAGPVYDILNCGPRHRFVVMGASGPFVVHNCIQALCRDVLRDAWLNLVKHGYTILWSVHDELVLELPEDADVKAAEAIMLDAPEWARFIPLAVESNVGHCYTK